MKNKSVIRLVESGLLLALAAVLSIVKLLDLPYGGSITACSMLPVILIAYRHGVKYGLFAATAYALIQLLLGTSTLSYFTSPLSIVAVIVLDYLVAFTVLGLGGIFRKGRPQGQALVLGVLLTGALRYLCHVIAGCTVWAGLSIPDSAALVYSLAYNATYMLPEVLVTALGAWYLSRAVDLSGERPARVAADTRGSVWSLVSAGAGAITAVTDIVLVFRHLQDPDTGDFIITGLANVDWLTVGIVTAVGVVIAVVTALISKSRRQ